MTATANYTIANWTTGMNISPHKGDRPAPTPRELIATRAVETKAGWVGQVIVDQEIVYETTPSRDVYEDDGRTASEAVQAEANDYVVSRIKRLFTDPDIEDGGRL